MCSAASIADAFPSTWGRSRCVSMTTAWRPFGRCLATHARSSTRSAARIRGQRAPRGGSRDRAAAYASRSSGLSARSRSSVLASRLLVPLAGKARARAWPTAVFLLGVRFECRQLVAPECFDFVEPRPKIGKRLWAELVGAYARVVFVARLFDDPRPAKYAEVPAHQRAAQIERPRDLARAARPLTKEPHRREARGIGKSQKYRLDVVVQSKLCLTFPVTSCAA